MVPMPIVKSRGRLQEACDCRGLNGSIPIARAEGGKKGYVNHEMREEQMANRPRKPYACMRATRAKSFLHFNLFEIIASMNEDTNPYDNHLKTSQRTSM